MEVYFIGTAGLRFIKVGVSQSPFDRLQTLQTGHPEVLCLVATIRTYQPYVLERRLHSQLSCRDSHVRGEWFLGPAVGKFLLADRFGETVRYHLPKKILRDLAAIGLSDIHAGERGLGCSTLFSKIEAAVIAHQQQEPPARWPADILRFLEQAGRRSSPNRVFASDIIADVPIGIRALKTLIRDGRLPKPSFHCGGRSRDFGWQRGELRAFVECHHPGCIAPVPAETQS